MPAPAGLPEVRELIRTTVSDRSAWRPLLEGISTLIPSHGAWLVADKDHTPDLPSSASLDDKLREYFGGRWFEADRLCEMAFPLFSAGRPIVTSPDICDDRYLARDTFHNEFAVRHRIEQFMGLSFKAGDGFWAISFLRSAERGPYTAAERETAAALIGDLATAATVATLLGREAVGTLSRTLELTEMAAVALDARGAVVHANDRWTRLLPKLGDDLSVGRGGRIAARDRASNAAIHGAIAEASGPREGTAVTTVSIARREGRPIIGKAIPVRSIGYNPFSEAKLVLVLPDPGQAPEVTAERVRDLLRVTSAESRLMLALRAGETVTSAAASLGISKLTARTQLKSIFAKLDVHDQRELLEVLRRI